MQVSDGPSGGGGGGISAAGGDGDGWQSSMELMERGAIGHKLSELKRVFDSSVALALVFWTAWG